MAYFHWSILNLVTLPQSLWSRRRRTELLQTWLALIPRFPHCLLRWFLFSSFENEMVPDFIFPGLSRRYALLPLQRKLLLVQLCICWSPLIENNELCVKFGLFSLFLSLSLFSLSVFSLCQPGTNLVKHCRIFFYGSLLVFALMHICSSLTQLLYWLLKPRNGCWALQLNAELTYRRVFQLVDLSDAIWSMNDWLTIETVMQWAPNLDSRISDCNWILNFLSYSVICGSLDVKNRNCTY